MVWSSSQIKIKDKSLQRFMSYDPTYNQKQITTWYV